MLPCGKPEGLIIFITIVSRFLYGKIINYIWITKIKLLVCSTTKPSDANCSYTTTRWAPTITCSATSDPLTLSTKKGFSERKGSFGIIHSNFLALFVLSFPFRCKLSTEPYVCLAHRRQKYHKPQIHIQIRHIVGNQTLHILFHYMQNNYACRFQK